VHPWSIDDVSIQKRSYSAPAITDLGSASDLTQQVSPVQKPGTNPDFPGAPGSFFYNVSTGAGVGIP
jgi:hypothetical protein